MYASHSPRRVLLLTPDDSALQRLFTEPALMSWEPVRVEHSAAAVLIHQCNPCDVLLADHSHYQHEHLEDVTWLAQQGCGPILLVADVSGAVVARAYEQGVTTWLPYQQTLAHPLLLAGALTRTAEWRDLQTVQQQTRKSLLQSRCQVDRLVSLLWRTGPLEIESRWYSQRHMLERLNEELLRAQRHDMPISVALGEVQSDVDSPDLLPWTAGLVNGCKRRCDVAGQYGLNNFMLLMPQTDAAGGVTCCRRLQQLLEETGPHDTLRTYFGVSTLSNHTITPQRLLRHAEEHLEAAKTRDAERIVYGTA